LRKSTIITGHFIDAWLGGISADISRVRERASDALQKVDGSDASVGLSHWRRWHSYRIPYYEQPYYKSWSHTSRVDLIYGSCKHYPPLKDVRLSIFALAVFYAGLFFILGPEKSKKSRLMLVGNVSHEVFGANR
jgi:hypothetical protein